MNKLIENAGKYYTPQRRPSGHAYFGYLDDTPLRRRAALKKMFMRVFPICIKEGTACGIKAFGRYVAFILWFDYNKLKYGNPEDFNYVFYGEAAEKAVDITAVNRSIQCADKLGSHLIYLLSAGVAKNFRR